MKLYKKMFLLAVQVFDKYFYRYPFQIIISYQSTMSSIYISFDRLYLYNYKKDQVLYICVMSNDRHCFSTTKKKCQKQVLNFYGERVILPIQTNRLHFSIIQVKNNKVYAQLAKFVIGSKQIDESLNKKQSFVLSNQYYKLIGNIKKNQQISQITIEQTEQQFQQQFRDLSKNNIAFNPQANFQRIFTPKGSTSNQFFKKQGQKDIDAKSDVSPSKSSRAVLCQDYYQNNYLKKKTSSTGLQNNHQDKKDRMDFSEKQNRAKSPLSKKKYKLALKDMGKSLTFEKCKEKLLIGGIIGLISGIMAASHSF